MIRPSKQLLFWTPRILGILFALFLSMFALDVFGEGYGFWGTLLALFMHLIPVYVLLIGLALAWRPFPLIANLIGALPIAGPALLIGILFLIGWLYKPQLQAST